MPAFNFKPQFAPLVESVQKTQTIRRTKRGNVGDTAYLFTGQRTKDCRSLGEGILTFVDLVSISRECIAMNYMRYTNQLADEFARADGFSNFEEMKTWFDSQYSLPFTGWLHVWGLKEAN